MRNLIAYAFGLALLLGDFAIAQDHKPIRFINDAQTVSDYLAASPANNVGVSFIDSAGNRLWFSDGVSWQSKPFSDEQIAVYDAANSVTNFNPGTTQATRNAAIAGALAALSDGATLIVPRRSGVYEIAATDLTADRLRINLGGNVLRNIADGQSYLLNLSGDHSVIENVVVRNSSTSGLGRMLQITGDNVFVHNIRNDAISVNPGSSPFAVFVTSTADATVLDRVIVSADTTALISSTDITGGVRIDGTNAIVQNCRFDSVQGHSIQSNSTVPNGSITIQDTVLIYDNDRLKNPDGVIGGINMSVLESAGGQWSRVKIENVTYKRIGSYNSPNALSAIKLHRVKSAVLDNVSIDAGTPTNKPIEINIDNDGPDAEGVIDQLVIRNSEIRCPIRTFSSSGIENLTIEDSILDKGLQTTDNNFFLVGGRVGTWKARRLTCEGQGVVSTTSFFRSVNCDRAIFEDIEFNLPSGSPFFLSNGIDLNQVSIRDFNAPNGGTFTRVVDLSDQQANQLLMAKRPGTFDEYVATAGGPPTVLGSNSFWSMSDGARAISDNPSVTNDYYYQAGAWQPNAGGGSGSADGVVSNVQLTGTDLDFTGANGGFNGTVDLSTLGGSTQGIDSVLALSQNITAPRGINLNGFDLTISGNSGDFTVANANDILLAPIQNLRLNTIGNYVIGDGAGGNVPPSDGDSDMVLLGYDPDTGFLETTPLGGSNADGVVSNVQLTGANLIFSGANGGFAGTIDLSPISSSPNPLDYKTSGQQSSINQANTFPDQGSIGPPPVVASNSIYHTIDTSQDTIASYYAMDKGSGLQWYALGQDTPQVGINDVLSLNQNFTQIQSINQNGFDFLIQGNSGDFTVANADNITLAPIVSLNLHTIGDYIIGDGAGGNVPTADGDADVVMLGYDPDNGHFETTEVQIVRQSSENLTPGQTAINATNRYSIVITSATPETISSIVGGTNGQMITLHFNDANVSFSGSSGVTLDTTDGNYTAQAGGASFTLERVGGIWKEISRRIF